MESRFGGESRSVPCYSYSSESRGASESRDDAYYWGESSESRYGGESRNIPACYNYTPAESRVSSESRCMESRVTSSRKATTMLSSSEIQSSLETIDALIEKLDVPIEANTTRLKRVATERGRKIAELRKLRDEIVAKGKEDEAIKQIEEGNEELDQAIRSLRNKLK